ncbi:MAG: UDP-N-acetylmuramate dehydrogenase [Abditibacteriales bacterium]|nr:UDP-N-acetylmuramate dehydrogenase [Abditibacteriales bacterium]MDW8367800.1 UDP-N-acetylmuramate dehydrogenase [Abditibacteriales bacterium]
MNATACYLKIRELAASVSFNEPMARHTSLRVGGPADVFVEPSRLEELCAVVKLAHDEGAPLTVIGRGTNLLVRDRGIRGIVVRLGKGFDAVRIDGTRLTAGAATYTMGLAREAVKHGLAGLECLCGIPGTVGGAIWGNAGAAGGETADCLESVKCVNRDGSVVVLRREALEFCYRHSNIGDRIVVEATFALRPAANVEALQQFVQDHLRYRRQTQPVAEASAGCMFKNPAGYSAGKLLEELGAKGMRVGDAQVSEKHANFIINGGRASGEDILTLIRQLQQLAWERRGIRLETEVRIVGE